MTQLHLNTILECDILILILLIIIIQTLLYNIYYFKEKKLGVINEGADLEETGEQLECNNSDDAINVRHIRVSSWPEGQSGETRKEALLSMVSEVFQCIERNPETTILVHCM